MTESDDDAELQRALGESYDPAEAQRVLEELSEGADADLRALLDKHGGDPQAELDDLFDAIERRHGPGPYSATWEALRGRLDP